MRHRPRASPSHRHAMLLPLPPLLLSLIYTLWLCLHSAAIPSGLGWGLRQGQWAGAVGNTQVTHAPHVAPMCTAAARRCTSPPLPLAAAADNNRASQPCGLRGPRSLQRGSPCGSAAQTIAPRIVLLPTHLPGSSSTRAPSLPPPAQRSVRELMLFRKGLRRGGER